MGALDNDRENNGCYEIRIRPQLTLMYVSFCGGTWPEVHYCDSVFRNNDAARIW